MTKPAPHTRFLTLPDPGELEFFHQAILKRLEGAFRSAPSLRREGADMLDAQLRQRPADLGRTPAVDLAGLGSAEIMRAAVGVEAHRQTVPGRHLLERGEGRGRATSLDQKR